jgi:hypothetical protein
MIAQVNALLCREYGIDPARLSDKEWFALYAGYKYTEKQRYDLLVAANRQAMAEIINQLFPDEQQNNQLDT